MLLAWRLLESDSMDQKYFEILGYFGKCLVDSGRELKVGDN